MGTLRGLGAGCLWLGCDLGQASQVFHTPWGAIAVAFLWLLRHLYACQQDQNVEE